MRYPIVTPTFSPNFSHPLNQGLVLWLLATPGYNGFGSQKWLSTGTQRSECSLTNMDPATDWTGSRPAGGFGSLDFDGSNDYATVPLNLAGTDNITVSFWMWWNAFANDNDLAMELSANTNSNPGFAVNPNSSSTFFDVFSRGNVGFNGGRIARPSAAAWHHYSFTFDFRAAGTALEVTAYIDGAPVTITQTNNSNNTANFPNTTLYLMCRGGSTLFGAGRLADLRIHDRRLSDGEIVEQYAESIRGYPNLLNRVRVPVYAPAAPATGSGIIVGHGPLIDGGMLVGGGPIVHAA